MKSVLKTLRVLAIIVLLIGLNIAIMNVVCWYGPQDEWIPPVQRFTKALMILLRIYWPVALLCIGVIVCSFVYPIKKKN